jgi:Asp-tRNA(Asn)/Glu-tRNA(Gln) amidotransferase A subunit family amidase
VRRLDEAGAVLAAKLSLGELAMGDVWYGGQTRNPWKRAQGSSGSSAGPAAAVAAGLVGFALGSETTGSIESPCKRCGATGLRPTFGRVPRGGAMALSWSLDKLGPIARSAEDALLVLDAIAGEDAADSTSRDAPLRFDAGASVRGRRVGYVRGWFEGGFAHPSDRDVLAALSRAGVELVPFELPDLPYDVLYTILFVEAAAAFEELTTNGGDDALVGQERTSWPNLLRSMWYVPAVEYLQAERFRSRVIELLDGVFAGAALDALVAPHFDGQLMLITNHTGHPGLTLRSGFRDDGTPLGVTLYGRPFEEGALAELGMAIERDLGVGVRCPDL